MATAPKMPPVPTPFTTHEIENVLAFRTIVGAENINAGESKVLGTLETSRFDKIRLVADERIGSTCNVLIRLTITEGDEWVAFLDHILLTPHAQLTRVYDVPCTRLTVAIDGVGNPGTKGAVDVLIYGQY